jgi:glycine oxidase
LRNQAGAVKVVIVGAGVAGLAVGWRLAREGADVTLIERAEPGAGATGAAAGMIAVAGEATTSGGADAQFSRYSARLWPSFAAELEEMSGHDISYLRNGALIVLGPGEKVPLDRDLVETVDAARARSLEPMLTGEYERILWARDEGQVNNRALGPALAAAFGRAGGKLVRGDAIESIVKEQDRVVGVAGVRTRYNADAVVISAGAWSSQIDGLPREVRDSVRPIKGEMIALASQDGTRRLTRVVRGGEVYLVPRGNRILAGATTEDVGFDTTLSQDAAHRLFNAAVGLAPPLAGWKIEEHWAGFRPTTSDRLPLIGRTSIDGLFVATGQYRNGILFAPAIAEILRRVILERAPAPSEFDPRRFAQGVGSAMPF